MKTLMLLMIASLTHAWNPPVQRYDAKWHRGHNGEKDESALTCQLDITRLKGKYGENWIMLVLWSDARSRIFFSAQIPQNILPLKPGAVWQDGLGRTLRYENGVLSRDDGEIRFVIDDHFLFPERAEGKKAGENGRSGSYLECEF